MTPRKLVLASSSPQRQRLMRDAGYQFEVVAPDDQAECGACSSGGPAALVAELAARKMADVAGRLADQHAYAGALVISCDTVAECKGQILGKPVDEDHARAMLHELRGSVHRVFSGLAIRGPLGSGTCQSTVELAVSELTMDPISDEQLELYLASELWKGKAGGFGYQDREGWLHLHRGSESNVIGLPLELLAEMLRSSGYAD